MLPYIVVVVCKLHDDILQRKVRKKNRAIRMKKAIYVLMLVLLASLVSADTWCSKYPNALKCIDFENDNTENWSSSFDVPLIEDALGSKALKVVDVSGSAELILLDTWANQSNYFNVSWNNVSLVWVGSSASFRMTVSHPHFLSFNKITDVWFGADRPDQYVYQGNGVLDYKTPYHISEVKNITYEVFENGAGECNYNLYLNGNFSGNATCRGVPTTQIENMYTVFFRTAGSMAGASHFDNLLVCNSSATCSPVLEEVPEINITLIDPLNETFTNQNPLEITFNLTLDGDTCSLYSDYTGSFTLVDNITNSIINVSTFENISEEHINLTGVLNYFNFEDNSTNLTIDIATGNNATLLSGASYSDSKDGNRTGNYSLALVTDDYATAPDQPYYDFGTDGDFSISVWIRSDHGSDSQYHMIVDTRDVASDGIFMAIASDDTIQVAVDNLNFASVDTIDDAQWHHVVAVVNRDNAGGTDLWIDNVSQGVGILTNGVNVNTVSSLHIGRRSFSSGTFWDGDLDNLIIFNRTLTQEEITKIYNHSLFYQNVTEIENISEIPIGLNKSVPITMSYSIPENTSQNITHIISCNSTTGLVSNTTNFVSYDIISPFLEITSPTTNGTVFSTTGTISSQCSDSNLLDFQGVVRQNNATGNIVYQFGYFNVSTQFQQEILTLDNSYATDEYYYIVNCTDGHTNNDISELVVTKVNNQKIIYELDGVTLTEMVVGGNHKAMDPIKVNDRYVNRITFDNADPDNTVRKKWKCSEDFRDVLTSDMQFHKVCGKMWVDELIDGATIEVNKDTKNQYDILIRTDRQDIVSKSVGVLNTEYEQRSFYIDNTPPNVTLLTPTNTTFQATANLVYLPSDTYNIDNCSIYLNGDYNTDDIAVENNVNNTFTITPSIGTYNYTINCTDIYNNTGGSEQRVFTVVPIPPTYYNNTIVDNTNWFNSDLFGGDSVASVFLYFFILMLLIGGVIYAEYTGIPILFLMIGIFGFFFSILLYTSISSLIGIFGVFVSVFVMIRGSLIAQE